MNTVYATASLCGKYDLPFYVPLQSEAGLPKAARSYLHYAAEHQSMVAAKCLATDWLLSVLRRGGSVREYFGGAGVVSAIIRGALAPAQHVASDRDSRCVAQLRGLLGEENAWEEDAREALILTERPVDLAVLDFPNFTALHEGGTRWGAGLAALFRTQPGAVVVTDTARSYLHVHKKTYEEFLKAPIAEASDYTRAFSNYLLVKYGYAIQRAAYRGRNTAYYLCVPSDRTLTEEEAYFPLKGSEHGFVLCCR